MTNTHFATDLRNAIHSAEIKLFGDEPLWVAPVAIVDAPNGFGEEVWDLAYPNLLSWMMKGTVISECARWRGQSTTAGDGAFGLQPSHAPGRYRASGPVRFGHFWISEGLLARVGEGLAVPDLKPLALRDDHALTHDRVLLDMLNLYARRSQDSYAPPSRIEMEARALLIVERLLARHHQMGQKTAKRGGLAPWQLKRTCEAMKAGIEGDIGLDALAQIAGCSTVHFSRAFKQSTGLPPFAWLLLRRIERAKELLSDPTFPLAEVALAVGFSAQPQFTTAFKRVTGMTPGQWRRERLS